MVFGSADAFERLQALSRGQKRLARRLAIEALAVGVQTANPRNLLQKHVRQAGHRLRVDSQSFDLSKFDRIFVLGGGKASALMASEVERILGDRITNGLVNIPDYLTSVPSTKFVLLHKATHPLPSRKGVEGVEAMLAMTRNPTRQDLVICLFSGGGSALMPLPASGLRIGDKRLVTGLLLKSGARIEEINAVRKHLSAIKGGRFAERLYPATVITLIISDVVTARLDSIASGPTAPDKTTFGDAKGVLKRYGLWCKVSKNVRHVIVRGEEGLVPETPKEGSRVFDRVHSFVVGSNRDSCVAAARFLRKAGYKTLVLSAGLQGEARQVGTVISNILSESPSSRFSLTRPFALVAGGETTVTVHGNGQGGRNQELVLSAALGLAGEQGLAVGSMGTDGIDGPTRAAGAVADGGTVELATHRRLEPESFLKRNDSYNFFEKLNSLIITGPTGTNVGDLLVAVAVDKSKSEL